MKIEYSRRYMQKPVPVSGDVFDIIEQWDRKALCKKLKISEPTLRKYIKDKCIPRYRHKSFSSILHVHVKELKNDTNS